MLATQIRSNTWVFGGNIWVANSSCRYICILVGFAGINTINACSQTNGLWSPSFAAVSCLVHVIWVFRVAKGTCSILRCMYLMHSHMVAKDISRYCEYKRVLFAILSIWRYWGYLPVFKVWSECVSIWLHKGITILLNFCQIPPNTIWELALTLHLQS